MKTGLALQGGALRGLFTCGVTDTFMREGIDFDGAAGISAGAAFGCNIKSRQDGRALRYNKTYCKDPRYCGIKSLITTGNIFGVDLCYKKIPFELDPFDYKTFQDNPMQFYVGAFDIERGEMVYHTCKEGLEEDIEWIRASSSMPLVSTIVEIDGRKLLDGGIIDSIPYEFMEEKGYDKIVTILTRPKDYVMKKAKNLALIKLVYHKYPKLIEALECRYKKYNEQINLIRKREAQGKAFVICPDTPLPINRIEKDSNKMQKTYDIGVEKAKSLLSDVKKFLSL